MGKAYLLKGMQMLLKFTDYKVKYISEITEKQWLFLIMYLFYQHILRTQVQLGEATKPDIREGPQKTVCFLNYSLGPYPFLVKSYGAQ